MKNSLEDNLRLKDARASLESANRAFLEEDWRVTIQNAQLCVELSAKAIISYFAEPEWTHNPGEQLLKIANKYQDQIEERYHREDMIIRIHQLSSDAKEAAPWHGRSTYGWEDEEMGRIASVDLCTREVAERLLEMARNSFETAQVFTEGLVTDENPGNPL